MIRIEVPGIPPSLNELKRMHYHQWNRTKRDWAYRIALMSRRLRPPKPLDRAVVTLIYHFPDRRRRDPDNFSGKFILDPLVSEGFIVDDSFDHIELRHKKGKPDKRNPRVVIEIEEAKG